MSTGAVGDTTQARRRRDIELMAREYISLVTDTPIEDVSVTVSVRP
jgi:hypothetical protein